jgi:hypothetical protein
MAKRKKKTAAKAESDPFRYSFCLNLDEDTHTRLLEMVAHSGEELWIHKGRKQKEVEII